MTLSLVTVMAAILPMAEEGEQSSGPGSVRFDT